MSIGEGYIVNAYGDIVKPLDLKVHRVLDPNLDPLYSDFTVLGFRKVSPRYSRGRKARAEFRCNQFDEIVAEKIFEDSFDEHGQLNGIWLTVNLYNEAGDIGATKTEKCVEFNVIEAETHLRQRRARQMDFLKVGARGTPIESYLNLLLERYYVEKQKYVNDGLSSLYDVIANEQDAEYLGYLDTEVPRLDGEGMITVRDSIYYQIGVIEL